MCTEIYLDPKYSDGLLPLPTYRFQFSVWNDLSEPTLLGSELKNPRIRLGPPDVDLYKLEGQRPIHHERTGWARKRFRDQIENWEELVICNLSYQDLGCVYQDDNFLRVLKRLNRVEQIYLMHNNIRDLSDVSFPRCEKADLSCNLIKHFSQLPKMTSLVTLNLSDNCITSLDGISSINGTNLQNLDLRGNAVLFRTDNYRFRVFQSLPDLKVLDGIKKKASDLVTTPETFVMPPNRTCSIL